MKRTQEAYLRAIRKLSEFLNLMPDVAVEDDLLRYILFAKNDKSWSSSSLNVAYNGIKFFYRVTCPRDWQTLRTLRLKHERKLPTVISTSEVKILLRVIDKPSSRTELGQPRNLDSHSSSLLRDSLARSGCQSQAIQKYLGHKSLNTTMIYLHLTTVGEEHAIARINDLMKRWGDNDAHTRADVFRLYGPAYLEKYRATRCPSISSEPCEPSHIAHARTRHDRLSLQVLRATARRASPLRQSPLPNCQGNKAREWKRKALAHLLPCSYFMVTFTVPEALRAFIRSHPKECYRALLDSSIDALVKLAKDPKFVGSELIGATGRCCILRGRDLCWNPHVHVLVPGGAISKDRSSGCRVEVTSLCRSGALSSIFRANSDRGWPKLAYSPRSIPRSGRFRGM